MAKGSSGVIFLRVPDKLAERVREEADNNGKSVNLFLTHMIAEQLNMEVIRKSGQVILRDRTPRWEDGAAIQKTGT